MKKLIALFALGMLAGVLSAQTTAVTATITDPDSQTWNYASWIMTVVSPRGGPTVNGVAVSPSLLTAHGLASSSGVITGNIATTTGFDQGGAFVQFNICSNTSAPNGCFTTTATTTGSTQNLSSALSAAAPAPRFFAVGALQYGYSDKEVITPVANGSTYYNVNTPCSRQYSNAGWQCGSGGSGTPGGTSGQIQFNNSGSFGGFTMSGDATTNTGTGVLTLATVNSTTGLCGDATHVCQITSNGKGLITLQAAVAITGGGSGITCSTSGGLVYYNGTAYVCDTTALTDGSGGLTAKSLTTNGGSSGPISGTETTCSGGTAGKDLLCPDSTLHRFQANSNNQGYRPVTLTIASGTAALGTSAISSAACAATVTVTASGVLTTDAISWTPNGSLTAVTGYVPSTSGGLTIAAYPTNNAVNFDVCNWTSGSITPGAVTINFYVAR